MQEVAKSWKPSRRELTKAARDTQAGKTSPLFARAGGLGRFIKLSPERRSEIARLSANARWAKLSPERRSEMAYARWAKIRAERARQGEPAA